MEIICVGLVFYVIVSRDQNDTISCSWIFQNKFKIVYIFRGWCYCTVIPRVKDLLAFMHGRLCEDLLRGRNAYL